MAKKHLVEYTKVKSRNVYINIFFVKAYSQSAWDEIEPGRYEYPFALKVSRIFV